MVYCWGKRINHEIQSKIETSSNTIFLSNVSLWEIAIKVSIGKLKLKVSMNDLKNYFDENGFKILDYDFFDLETLLQLPFHHQDPFDRMIVAQGKTKSLEIITNDSQIKKYFKG